MAQRIYLDHAATTPLRAEVRDAMLPYLGGSPHNPSSLHAEGRRARAILDDARERVARALGATPREIIFTSGGSEGNNHALVGVAQARQSRGRHILSTRIEHHAVLHTLDTLRERHFEIELLPVDESGRVDPNAFAAALRPDTILASVMYANNEIGVVQPVAELARMARAAGAAFHTDAVQAPTWLALGEIIGSVDFLTLSAHKFQGPVGVGVLFARAGEPCTAFIHGGSQEGGRRAGTENVAGVVGLACALELAVAERAEKAARIARLRDRLESGILASIPDARVHSAHAERLANIANLAFVDLDSEVLLMQLDLGGIAASAGSACAAGALEPSHVIAALGGEERWQRGVVRFSLGAGTTEAEIDHLLAIFPSLVETAHAFVTSSA